MGFVSWLPDMKPDSISSKSACWLNKRFNNSLNFFSESDFLMSVTYNFLSIRKKQLTLGLISNFAIVTALPSDISDLFITLIPALLGDFTISDNHHNSPSFFPVVEKVVELGTLSDWQRFLF